MKIKIKLWVKIVIAIIFIISFIYIDSRYIETKGLNVKEYPVVDSNIPESFYGFKIVHISDIHLNVTTTITDLKEIVKEINLLKPDIVLFSGDLFDSKVTYKDSEIEALKKVLNQIDYSVGKYAIKGEEDLNITYFDSVMNDSGFKILDNDYELIYNEGMDPILLVGINSNYKKNHIKESIDEINSKINTNYKYSILLLHEADFIQYIDSSKFNLILAGHTHKGQVFIPFIGGLIKDKYSKLYTDDSYEINNTNLFISSGIGTSKYKFRLFNKPSINLYRLRNK